MTPARKTTDEYAVTYQLNPAHSGSVTFEQGFKTPLTQLWAADTPDQIEMPYAVVADGRVFVTSGDTNGYGSQLYAPGLSSGAQLWHQLFGTIYVSLPRMAM